VIELELVGVRVEFPANQPIVLLKEKSGTRYLPIWIGAVEATAIAFALQGVNTPRPLTHDLFKTVLLELQAELNAVHITELRDGTFYAELKLTRAGESLTISARPSDAVALAARFDAVPIWSAEDVLDAAGIELDDDAELQADDGPDDEDQLREFRAFLDEISPDDFRGQ
jgi:bifunctional DNase/RNase